MTGIRKLSFIATSVTKTTWQLYFHSYVDFQELNVMQTFKRQSLKNKEMHAEGTLVYSALQSRTSLEMTWALSPFPGY